MKKKIALIFAIIFSLGALALTACTDKNEQPRELDSIELSIVGTWKKENDKDYYTFKDDGTCTLIQYDSSGAKSSFFNFYHIGEDVETDGEKRGHYYKIYFHEGNRDDALKYCGSPLVIFDIYPNKLMWISNGMISATEDKNNFILQTSEPNNETTLDSVEKSMVGEWQRQEKNSVYMFNANGTYSVDGENNGKFKHNGDGVDALFGHYNVIEFNKEQWRLYDFANGVIYSGGSHQPFLIKNGSKRILHNCEKTILGTWQASTSKSTQFTFYSNGTVTCTSWSSTKERYFYIRSEGDHNTKGHYYVFSFPNTGLSDWYIFDNDSNSAYQNASGAIYASRI